MQKTKKSLKLDLITLAISLVAAYFYHYLGDILMTKMYLEGYARPVITAAYFLCLGLALILVICISICVMKYRTPGKKDFITAIVLLLVVTLLAAGFEAIYDLNFTGLNEKNGTDATSYIFVIDDSGSMYDSDPTGAERTAAIQAAMQDLPGSFPFCVYKFGGDAERLTDMMKAQDIYSCDFSWTESFPATDYVTSLSTVLDDIENGEIAGVGKHPTILFMSDGEWGTSQKYQTYINSELVRAVNLGVKIDTVGLGDNEFTMLEFMADKTGGAFTTSDNIGGLANAFKQVLTNISSKDRMLLTARDITNYEGLYAAERILFLMVLGALFFFIKAQLVRQANGEKDSVNYGLIMVPLYAVILAIGAAGIEVGMNMLGWQPGKARAILCLCFLLIITFDGRNASDPRNGRRTAQTITVDTNQNGFTSGWNSNSNNNSGPAGWENTGSNSGWNNNGSNGNSGWGSGNDSWNNGGFGGSSGNGWGN